MRTPLAVALAIVALAFTPASSATDFCDDPPLVDVAGQFYVTVDAVLEHGYLWSIWVYCESNGQPGLQRGGITLLGDPDICQESSWPDTCFGHMLS